MECTGPTLLTLTNQGPGKRFMSENLLYYALHKTEKTYHSSLFPAVFDESVVIKDLFEVSDL